MNAAVLNGNGVSTPLIRTHDNLISNAHRLRELDACRTVIGGCGLLAAPGATRRQCRVTVAVSLGGRNAQSKGPAPGVVAMVGLAPFAPSAHADDTDATVDLGKVVVTARRRDEKIVDAPVAVTVQTGEQLKDQNAVLFDDIAREVPNLRMMPSPQSVSALDVTMRGQTSIRSAIAYDPAVGIYVDGVYVANGQAAMSTLLDIKRGEMVRGAQGTLLGRDNTGSAISFYTNR